MPALLVLLSLAAAPLQSTPKSLPGPAWKLHVNSQDWCAGGNAPGCALRELDLANQESQPVALPKGAPWSCLAGETKSVNGRMLRTLTCSNDAGKSAVRSTAVVEGARATTAELGLDWKDASGRHHSVSLTLAAPPAP